MTARAPEWNPTVCAVGQDLTGKFDASGDDDGDKRDDGCLGVVAVPVLANESVPFGQAGADAARASTDKSARSSPRPSRGAPARSEQRVRLLLRSAAACPHHGGSGGCSLGLCGGDCCPGSTARLCRHAATGRRRPRDGDGGCCLVGRCLSSRYVLSHLRRCDGDGCEACAPLKRAMRLRAEEERLRLGAMDGEPEPPEEDEMSTTDSEDEIEVETEGN